jgi:cytidylate kinase
MPVITISREFGSQGRQIAGDAAHALGYHFMDKNSIGKVLDDYGLVEFDREYEAAPGFWDRFDADRMKRREQMVVMLNRIILALARHGNMVILGRCGFAVLHGYADVLNVRIQAPLNQRIEQVMRDEKLPNFEQAEAFVKENDQIRTAFIESFYEVPWDSATAFDLVIDTSKVHPDMAAEWIVSAVNALKKNLRSDARTATTIPVDQILYTAICEELRCTSVHNP